MLLTIAFVVISYAFLCMVVIFRGRRKKSRFDIPKLIFRYRGKELQLLYFEI